MSFGLDNLPYGSLVDPRGRRFAAVRFGDEALNLTALFPDLFAGGTLDRFLAAGPQVWGQVRAAVIDVLAADREARFDLRDLRPVQSFTVGDYVDFYASEHHATNAGTIFRPGGEALPPSWKHQPIGYYGRAAALQLSGTDVRRPSGQVRSPDGVAHQPSERLDFEAEVAFVVGSASEPGRPVSVAAADQHVFGVCLLNDWSARDIQAFEAAPLGPFLGKSFATSIAAWITPLAALQDARIGVRQDPRPLPHLQESAHPHGLAIDLEIALNGTVLSRPSFADMYWSYGQMLAHLTSNGAHLRTGDVFASGTVSGAGRDQRGCLLELTWNGTEPLTLSDGATRTWLQNGDEVVISGQAGSVTLGEVRARVVG